MEHIHKVYCQEHKNEPITNFCANLDCMKALCPECIFLHTKYHMNNQTSPEINSLKTVKTNCNKKIMAGISSLKHEQDKIEKQYMTNPEALINEGLSKLNKCKENIFQIVINFFDDLEEKYRKRVHEKSGLIDDFSNIFEKMTQFILELEYLNNNLNSSQEMIESIHKVIQFKFYLLYFFFFFC